MEVEDPSQRQMWAAAGRRSWRNGPDKVEMWEMVSKNDMTGLMRLLDSNPSVVHMRSGDGRGPLWWAYEYNRQEMIRIFTQGGADQAARDALGMQPADMGQKDRASGEL